MLTRPDGFPARVTVLEAGSHAVEAYDEQRYDDLDLPWTGELLEGELRLTGADGFQWLRSARQVHIFAQDPNEPELISASAASAGIAHTLICRSGDAGAVRLAAASTGSPELQTHEHWQGIPDGWTVLSGYTPAHAATLPLSAGLRTLDPGEGLEISFDGGLAVRGRVYAAGHPPRIMITPAPGNASVTIGGEPAELSSDGAWTAPGWDRPGQHMVDVVPGPSVSYEIAADPWLSGGWDFWDAHPQRFGDRAGEPWSRARICGALIRGPADETVFAAESQPTLVALGPRSGATPLRRIAYAKGAFDAYYHPKPSLFRNEREELSNLVRQIAGNAGCERYVVVTRGQGMLPGTNLPLRGLGILNRGVGPINYSFLYAYVGVTVFDGQTFEIRKGPGVTLEGVMKHMADNFVQDEHLRKVDNSLFPAAAAEASSNTTLRDNIREFLTERLDKILPPYFAQ